ncbi:PBECR4 domain-containing protein [Streptococcus suis]|uniref:PBECR4 domain-containing protein n=1 Tax=Streptococcus suis TaxID=1307 RepID=UPI000CF645FB|nr:PBECR4 domain-containing protein [Streptococcus suis]
MAKFTKEDAKAMSILDVARSLGMELKQRSTQQWYWVEHDSFIIDTRKNIFFWNAKGLGGDAIELVETIKEVDYKQAMHYLRTGEFPKVEMTQPVREPFRYVLGRFEQPFIEARDFLKEVRGLSDDTINFFGQAGVLTQANKKASDDYLEPVIVFKSLDKQGNVIGASLQGIVPNKERYEGKGYLKQIAYNSDGLSGMRVDIGTPKRLVFAEAPIDLMSYYEANKGNLSDVRLVAMDGLKSGTVSRYTMELLAELQGKSDYKPDLNKVGEALEKLAKVTTFFQDGKNSDLITLAVDNDKPGRDFIERLQAKGIPVQVDLPPLPEGATKMDWNDHLKSQKAGMVLGDSLPRDNSRLETVPVNIQSSEKIQELLEQVEELGQTAYFWVTEEDLEQPKEIVSQLDNWFSSGKVDSTYKSDLFELIAGDYTYMIEFKEGGISLQNMEDYSQYISNRIDELGLETVISELEFVIQDFNQMKASITEGMNKELDTLSATLERVGELLEQQTTINNEKEQDMELETKATLGSPSKPYLVRFNWSENLGGSPNPLKDFSEGDLIPYTEFISVLYRRNEYSSDRGYERTSFDIISPDGEVIVSDFRYDTGSEVRTIAEKLEDSELAKIEEANKEPYKLLAAIDKHLEIPANISLPEAAIDAISTQYGENSPVLPEAEEKMLDWLEQRYPPTSEYFLELHRGFGVAGLKSTLTYDTWEQYVSNSPLSEVQLTEEVTQRTERLIQVRNEIKERLQSEFVPAVLQEIQKAPEQAQEHLIDRTSIGTDSLQLEAEGSVKPVSNDTFEQTVTSHPTSSYPLLHFSTNFSEIQRRIGNYHPITEADIKRLNQYAPSIQNTAQWYSNELAGSFVYFVYASQGQQEVLSVNFRKENFVHLTGIRPFEEGKGAADFLDDFVSGRGHYDSILVSNSLKHKLQALPMLSDILDPKSFILDNLTSVEKLHKLDMSEALKSKDEDFLLLFKDAGEERIPASLMKIKGDLKTKVAAVDEKVILGIYRERSGIIDQLSINKEYVKDGGKEFLTILQNRQLEPIKAVVKEESLEEKNVAASTDIQPTPAADVSLQSLLESNDSQALFNHLKEGMKEYVNSDKYKQFLQAISKFHDYSIYNVHMMLLQKPDISLVASYRKWKTDFDRQVQKGEKGIKIWVPMTFKEKDKIGQPVLDVDGQEKTITRFKLGTVFDVSQTAGKEIPKPVYNLESAVPDYQNIYRAARHVSQENGVKISFQPIDFEANGYYHIEKNEIVIADKKMSEAQILKTLFHEMAHSELHHHNDGYSRSERELQAESIAYVVANHFGIDTSEYSFAYLHNWSLDKQGYEDLENQLKVVQAESKSLINRIDKSLELVKNKSLTTNKLQSKIAQAKQKQEQEKQLKSSEVKQEKSKKQQPTPKEL